VLKALFIPLAISEVVMSRQTARRFDMKGTPLTGSNLYKEIPGSKSVKLIEAFLTGC
jgi:hypothetical protein